MRKHKRILNAALMAQRVSGGSRNDMGSAVDEKRKTAFARIYSSNAFSAESAMKAFAHIAID